MHAVKRAGPLKRVAFRSKREGPTSAREMHPSARKEAKEQAPRTPAAKVCAYVKCGKEFVPSRPMQAVCSPRCVIRKAEAEVKARKAAEKELTRARKVAIKTRRQWIAEAQAAVNKYARLRDQCAGRGCISCGSKPKVKYGGAADAGHFRSVGSAPHLRYYLPQIRLQCVRCNRHLGGNVVEYRRGLVALLGLARVEQIEAMQGVAKWSVQYLCRLKTVMAKKARRLEKRHAMQG